MILGEIIQYFMNSQRLFVSLWRSNILLLKVNAFEVSSVTLSLPAPCPFN
jgi:hypothetical protein